MFAALAKGLPMLGGLGGGGSTKVSNSVSTSVGNSVNPSIGVSLGGGVYGSPDGSPQTTAPSAAYAVGPDGLPSSLPTLGMGYAATESEPYYADTGAPVPLGASGDLLSSPLVWVGLAAAAFFVLRR